MKRSWTVLKQDKELAVLPVISGVLLLGVAASFAFGMDLFHRDIDRMEAGNLLPLFGFYVVSYTVGFFFQAALVAGALERLNGGDPTLGSALRAAGKRFGAILMWGVFAGTVGMLLRAVQERSGIVGKIVAGLIGVAWSLATFFMVPVLVMEQHPVGESFKRSWALFKQTWGETVVGNGGLGLVTFLAVLVVMAVAALFFAAHLMVFALIALVLGLILVMVVSSALGGIYLASLYRFATTGQVADGFERAALAGAYRPK
jgi:hypothetical protein